MTVYNFAGVALNTPPTAGQVPIWDGTRWIPGNVGGLGTGLLLPENLALVSSYDTSWQVNGMAPLARSTDDEAISVVVFDDDFDSGTGFMFAPADENGTLSILTRPRGFIADASAQFTLFARTLLGSPGVWAPVVQFEIDFTSSDWINVSTNLDLSTLIGQPIQFELVRDDNGAILQGVEVSQLRID